MPKLTSQAIQKQIVRYLKSPKYRPLRQHELQKALGIEASKRSMFRKAVKTLEDKGKTVRNKNNEVLLFKPSKLTDSTEVAGVLSLHPDGFGFVKPDAANQPDIFIPPRATHGARQKDYVLVAIKPKPTDLPRRRGSSKPQRNFDKGPEGEIVRILERGMRKAAGLLRKAGTTWTLVPKDSRFPERINVTQFDVEPVSGAIAVIDLSDASPDEYEPMAEGRLVEIIGKPSDSNIDMLQFIVNHQLPLCFPDEVMAQAKAIKVDASDTAGGRRKDLRKDLVITIDPEDARDFDDAISLKRSKKNTWLLGVHIADVSHYVPFNSPIDREAHQRGVSTYLVDRLIPMLPDNLTSDVCSLVPHQDRLTHTAEIELDDAGHVLGCVTYPSVIHSDARLTYEQAQHIIDGKEVKNIESRVIELVPELNRIALKLRDHRRKLGALEFSMPERRCKLNAEGHVEEITVKESTASNHLIEEFMLMANICVAEIFINKYKAAMYRVHEEPSDAQWNAMAQQLAVLGIHKEPNRTQDLVQIIDSIENKDLKPFVTLLILKNLKRAHYQETPGPHFGLAFEHYTHFTSPIRRYPDLIVHRLLNAIEENMSETAEAATDLKEAARHSSYVERNAEEAERESVEYKVVQYYERQISRGNCGPYTATVSGVNTSGIFVEISESLQRAFINYTTLLEWDLFEPDRNLTYAVGKRSGFKIRMGNSVEVTLLKADPKLRRIECTLGTGPKKEKEKAKKKVKTRRKKNPGRRN